MNNLFNEWRTKIPKYSTKFKDLFASLANKYVAKSEKVISLGKHFEVQYELYTYAFFLGLYSDDGRVKFTKDEKKTDFSNPIETWGSKRTTRKDYKYIQEYMFMAIIAKSDVDLLALEKGEIESKEVVKELINVLEEYTNGGLTIIFEKMEGALNPFLTSDSFMQLLVKSGINDK